ncbi:hypothetical protein B7P43_G10687, partial [Cryptotermes secundus]
MVSDIRNVTRGPGARMGSSLWFDSSPSSWWLFGGRQAPPRSTKSNTKLKIYTDLWRYDTSARGWSQIFPINKLKGNAGGMTLLRTNLFSDGNTQRITGTSNSNPGVVLCGRTEGKGLDERSLAVYAPRSSRSDTVWQLELKDKQWTAYVCCCDNTEKSTGQSTKNNSAMPIGTFRNETNDTRNFSVTHGSIQITDDGCNDATLNLNLKEEFNNYSNIDNTGNNTRSSKDDEIQSRTSEHSIKMDNRESNTPLSNQEISYKFDSSKKENNGSIPTQTPNAEEFVKDNGSLFSEHISASSRSGDMNNSESSVQYEGHSVLETGKHCLSDMKHQNVGVPVNNVPSNTNYSDLPEGHNDEVTVQTSANTTTHTIQQRDIKLSKDAHKKSQPDFDVTTGDSTSNQVFCPYFEISDDSNEKSRGQPVAWCDSHNELLAALDLKVIPLTLWQFDLKT